MHTLYARFNTGLLVFIALTGIVLVTMMATRAYGGPLDPPGAPGPTMKTLQQVEPRTPISQPASFPIQINASGSYYLTENITGVPGQMASINASNVTIDLNGFTLYGGGGEYGIIDPQQAGFCKVSPYATEPSRAGIRACGRRCFPKARTKIST